MHMFVLCYALFWLFSSYQRVCAIYLPMLFSIIHCHWGNPIIVVTSQITGVTIVYSTVYSDADRRKHQSTASLAFVWGIHRWPVNSPHKWPVTRKWFHLVTSSWDCPLSLGQSYDSLNVMIPPGVITPMAVKYNPVVGSLMSSIRQFLS